MDVLYKYLRKEHAKLLIENGKLRIGTLYEYRDTEKHGGVIGDDQEGTKSSYMEIEREVWTPQNQPEFSKGVFNLGEKGKLTIEGVTIERPTNSPDYYMFCTTNEFDEEALKDFGYDTCVVIEKPNEFFKAISRTLRHKAEFEGFFHVFTQSEELPMTKIMEYTRP